MLELIQAHHTNTNNKVLKVTLCVERSKANNEIDEGEGMVTSAGRLHILPAYFYGIL